MDKRQKIFLEILNLILKYGYEDNDIKYLFANGIKFSAISYGENFAFIWHDSRDMIYNYIGTKRENEITCMYELEKMVQFHKSIINEINKTIKTK